MKIFLDNFEEYLCSFGLVVMTLFTFLGVISRKLPQVNLSWTMEMVTTLFVWVCALAAAAAFKSNSHMGFGYLTDKLRGLPRSVHMALRMGIIFIYYGLWLYYGTLMVVGQYDRGLVTAVMSTPGWLIGLAIPFSAVLALIRVVQYERGYKFSSPDGNDKADRTEKE